jgi:hypothetical protein
MQILVDMRGDVGGAMVKEHWDLLKGKLELSTPLADSHAQWFFGSIAAAMYLSITEMHSALLVPPLHI